MKKLTQFFMEVESPTLNILRTKRAFDKELFLKGFQLPKIVSNLTVRL